MDVENGRNFTFAAGWLLKSDDEFFFLLLLDSFASKWACWGPASCALDKKDSEETSQPERTMLCSQHDDDETEQAGGMADGREGKEWKREYFYVYFLQISISRLVLNIFMGTRRRFADGWRRVWQKKKVGAFFSTHSISLSRSLIRKTRHRRFLLDVVLSYSRSSLSVERISRTWWKVIRDSWQILAVCAGMFNVAWEFTI